MVDVHAVAFCGLLDHIVEVEYRDRAQVVAARLEILEPSMALQLWKAVGADGEGELPRASRRIEGHPQIIGERLGALALRPRHLLGLIDADEDGRAWAGRGREQRLALGVDGVVEREGAGLGQFALLIPRGLRPHVEQPVADYPRALRGGRNRRAFATALRQN